MTSRLAPDESQAQVEVDVARLHALPFECSNGSPTQRHDTKYVQLGTRLTGRVHLTGHVTKKKITPIL